MAGSIIEKGKTIYSSGQPMTALHVIAKGKVQAAYPGGAYTLGEGDVIGICEICSEVHFVDYIVLEDVNLLTYPIKNIESVRELMQANVKLMRLFLLSLVRQVNTVIGQSSLNEVSCGNLYQTLSDDYSSYTTLCSRYRIQAGTLDLSETGTYLGQTPDGWLIEYYQGLQLAYSGEAGKLLFQQMGMTMGILRKGSLDFRQAYTTLEDQYQYRKQIAAFYFNKSGNDLFDMLTSLYYRLGQHREDADSLQTIINRIITEFENDPAIDQEAAARRIEAFAQTVAAQVKAEAAKTNKREELSAMDNTILSELAGSINTILEFAGPDLSCASSFREHTNAYKKLEDKSSTDDAPNRLRRQLTQEFNTLYATVFERSLEASYLPIQVRMFLYFGYVDEELAGTANCITLYNYACGMENTADFGVYTFYDWLLAIYNGEKNPSRNEFDEDYFDYIHKQKASGNLSDSQASSLEQDSLAKAKFELENMFAQVNKMTSGRVTSFCPLFAEDNVQKDLKSSYVTVSQINKALEMIRKIDYSVFYRESLDYENIDVMGKETIHLEFLPDVILMPNVGIRGVMWQEIEGKKRNTPSRMVFSLFHMEDINATMVRLAGEFRWEMCKRIQGSRWNDVSERSLTSEYFDYVQFYRKNRDLTNEAKEKIKNSLQRAKNSFKEMFVRDYIIWVLFEGTGSPRLNKVARKILLTYCPFPAELNKTMEQNPLFTEIIAHQNIVMGQKLHHVDVLMQKLRSGGVPIPETLENERAFVSGTIKL